MRSAYIQPEVLQRKKAGYVYFSRRLFPLLFHAPPQDPAHPGRPLVNLEKPDNCKVEV
jgi:hypothetical protein